MDIVAELWKILNEHWNQAFITCPEDCLCWEIDRLLAQIDALQNS